LPGCAVLARWQHEPRPRPLARVVGRALILSIQVAALGFAALRLVHPEIATSLRASRIDAPKNASRVRRYEVPISFLTRYPTA